MNVNDHRNDNAPAGLDSAVYAVDKFCSGWGQSQGGNSVMIWECRAVDVDKIERWAKGRGDTDWVGSISGVQGFTPLGLAEAVRRRLDSRRGITVAQASLYTAGPDHRAVK